MTAIEQYDAACRRLESEVSQACASGSRIRLRKDTSNLFRRRRPDAAHSLDVRRLNRVLHIDAERRLADVEGMLTYEDFVDATLRHNLLPCVVPELKTITVGGAVSGLGIESSSFRHGLVHESVESMDLLLGSGHIVHCSRTENSDLFFGFPNSYGTLGYALRLAVRLIPARPYVRLTHTRFTAAEPFLRSFTESTADFLDGTVFSRGEMYRTEGRFSDAEPQTSDYTSMKIYYQSIRRLQQDVMTTRDYIWRWDTDWFWCSKQFHLQNPVLRWFARPWLNSRAYQRWMRLAQRLWPGDGTTESVIQDVQIPMENACAFLDFLLTELSITPIWICPFRTSGAPWALTALPASHLYINFGFWDVVRTTHGPGHFNRMVEQTARRLGGTKALYSVSCYDEPTFWSIYDHAAYGSLKRKADPCSVLPDLFESVVRRSC